MHIFRIKIDDICLFKNVPIWVEKEIIFVIIIYVVKRWDDTTFIKCHQPLIGLNIVTIDNCFWREWLIWWYFIRNLSVNWLLTWLIYLACEIMRYPSLTEEQIIELPATTSEPTQTDAAQDGFAIFVTVGSPQTKKLGKSIPKNFSER